MFLKILEVKGIFLNNEKGVGIVLPKHYLIFMNLEALHDNGNLFHRLV